MAACIFVPTYRRGFAPLLRLSAVASAPHLLGPRRPTLDIHRNANYSNNQYSTSGPGAKFAKWLSRRLLGVIALAGFTGGALLVVSSVIC